VPIPCAAGERATELRFHIRDPDGYRIEIIERA